MGEYVHEYRCPSGHRWASTEREAPLVNIKCPDCSATAPRFTRAVPRSEWKPLPGDHKIVADFTRRESS